MSPRATAVRTLCELLKTGDEADRCYAARALGVIGDSAAVDALVTQLHDQDIDACVDAAEALGQIGSPRAVQSLVESLTNDPNGEICTAVVKSLGRLGSEAATQALRTVAAERPEGMEWDEDWDTWWDVQREAVQALGRLGDKRSVPLLVDILTDENQQDIESEILGALANISGPGTDVLFTRLRDPVGRPQHRRRAAKALGQAAASEKHLQALGRALKDAAPEVRAEVASALADQGAVRYIPALLLMLRDPAEEVRKSAVDAIARLSGGGATAGLPKELLTLLDDESPRVRAALYNCLSFMLESGALTQEAFAGVVDDLGHPEAETAAAACVLLGNNRDTRAVAALLRVLDDDLGHPMVRREAALTIGKLGLFNRAIATSLNNTLCDSPQAVRLAALTALNMLDQQDAGDDASEYSGTPMEIVTAAVEGRVKPLVPSSPGESLEPEGFQLDRTSDGIAESTESTNQESDAAASKPPKESNTETPALPESPARIVQEGEVKTAVSTLEAIAMDNVEATLGIGVADAPSDNDEEMQEYLAVVDANKESMARIRSERKIDPDLDIRRLAIRVLGDSDRAEAIEVLIGALKDTHPGLRKEAADAIGRIALRDPNNPALTDAVGILITLMTVDNQDQRLVCARTLGRLGNKTAVLPLFEVLEDPKTNVRIQAIEALSNLVAHGADPEASDHMVVRNLPPLSIARRIAESLSDDELAVRVAAARGLALILQNPGDNTYKALIVEKIIDSVFEWSGEEARLIGKALRGFDPSVTTEKLLARLDKAEDSVKRSVVIEMLEELLASKPHMPGHAA